MRTWASRSSTNLEGSCFHEFVFKHMKENDKRPGESFVDCTRDGASTVLCARCGPMMYETISHHVLNSLAHPARRMQ